MWRTRHSQRAVWAAIPAPRRGSHDEPVAQAAQSGIPRRSEFAAFDDPGYTKVAFTIRAEPYGANRTLVTTETRTATTDPVSRRQFAAYWRLIGPFSALMRRLILRWVKSRVERRAARP
jgi:hypothetical protein